MRHLLSLIIVALMTAWVGGQSPVALRSDVRAKLFRQNRVMIEPLVDKAIATVKSPSDHLKRADGYYNLLFQFNKEISQAIDRKDQARVVELSARLQTLVDPGLAPTLVQAQKQVVGGTGAGEFPVIKDQLVSQLDALLSTLQADPATKESLAGAKKRLLEISMDAAKANSPKK